MAVFQFDYQGHKIASVMFFQCHPLSFYPVSPDPFALSDYEEFRPAFTSPVGHFFKL